MDVDLGVVLLQQHPGLLGAVVGTAEQGGQRDHIDVLRAAAVGVQIGLGGGAGGGGGGLALLHGPEQVGLVEGLVIHEGAAVAADGEGHLDKAGVVLHLGGHFAAAVHDDFKTHIFHLQTWF